LNRLRANISTLKASWIPIVERIQSKQSPEAIREAVLASEDTFDGSHFNKDVDKFVAQQNAYVLSQDQALVRLLPSSGLLVFVVGLSGLILIGFLVFHAWFARHVLAPIAQFSHAADAISRGEVTETVTIERNDEIGSLPNSFGRMMTAVRFFQAEADAPAADIPPVVDLPGAPGEGAEDVVLRQKGQMA
jgi:nitrate/nitrite-specific signal transduction histidine kinase